MQTPAQPSAVAPAQRRLSRSPANVRASRPVNTGAEPMATTVPTATPVSSTAAKKVAWYAATQAPESRISRRSAPPSWKRPLASAISTSSAAPIAIRAVPTASGSSSGPRA